MRQRIKCVRATEVTNAFHADLHMSASFGIQWYQLTSDAEHRAR